jgi:hypothetical protein
MKIAVVGSRTFNDREKLFKELDLFHLAKPISLIISGGARGADQLAEDWAQERGISTQIFIPDWETHGKSAGFIRNADIIRSCDECIAFWDGKSRGTLHSINLAKAKKIPLKIIKN